MNSLVCSVLNMSFLTIRMEFVLQFDNVCFALLPLDSSTHGLKDKQIPAMSE